MHIIVINMTLINIIEFYKMEHDHYIQPVIVAENRLLPLLFEI